MANSLQETQQYKSATTLLQNLLYPLETSKYSDKVTTLAERIAAIPSETHTFVKMKATGAFTSFLNRELQHYKVIRDTENKAVETIANFIGAKPADIRNRMVISNTELSKQIQEVQGLMDQMRQNLNFTAYELEKKNGTLGIFSWMPDPKCTYFYKALAELEASQQPKKQSEPTTVIHVSSSAEPTATAHTSPPASVSSTSSETPNSSRENASANITVALSTQASESPPTSPPASVSSTSAETPNSSQELAAPATDSSRENASANITVTISTEANESPSPITSDHSESTASPRSPSTSPRASSSSALESDSSQELPTEPAVVTKSAPTSPRAEVSTLDVSTQSAPTSRRESLNSAGDSKSTGRKSSAAKTQASPPTITPSASAEPQTAAAAPPPTHSATNASSSQKSTRQNGAAEKKSRASKQL